MLRSLILLAPLLLAYPVAAQSTVRVATRDELVRALAAAKSGTTILIAPGTYRGGFSQARLQGTKEQSIVLAGADAKNPPVIEGGAAG